MKGFVLSLSLVLTILLLFVGCAEQAPNAEAAGLEPSAVYKTTNNVYWWWGDPAGSATLLRTDKGVSGTVSTSLASPGADAAGLAATLWIVVFNNPAACDDAPDPCGEADLFNEAVMPDVLYGAGNVVGGAENAGLGYRLGAGDTSGSIADLFGLPTNDGEPWGLVYPRGAEIHYVVRSHGPKVAREMPGQIHSFGGGCVYGAPFGHDPPAAPEDLQLGFGDCQDVQFSVHQP